MENFTFRACGQARLPLSLLSLLAALSAVPALAQPSAPPATDAAAAAPEAAAPRFDILEFQIEGNTRLSDVQIEAAVLPFLGEGRSMVDVDGARAALEKVYQGAGYLTVFVDVPEQRVEGGVVRLAVLEGRVERLAVTGSRYYAQGRIRTALSELAAGQVPNFNIVQQQLASVSRGEERRVQPVLRPGRQPGTVEAELKVEDKLPLSGSFELSNAASADTDPLRAAVHLRYDNLLQRDHSIALTLMGAPMASRESRVAVLNYTVPLADGDALTFTAVNSSSDVDSLGGVNVLGKGTTLGLRYSVSRALAESVHSLSLGLDFKDLKENVSLGRGADAAALSANPLRYMPLQAAYNGTWFGPTSQHNLSLTATLGLRRLLYREIDCQLADGTVARDDQFACKRRGADGGFSTLKLDWRGQQRLGPVELAARFGAQLATQQLPSSEQYSLGGADTVRGYYDGVAAGDFGWLGSLELRSRNFAPALLRSFEGANLPPFSELGIHLFADAASVSLIDPEPGQQRRVPLLSSGLGLRLALSAGLSLNLDWGRRHRDLPTRRAPQDHLHLRAALRF